MRIDPTTCLPLAAMSSSHPIYWNRGEHIIWGGPIRFSLLEFEMRTQKFPVQDGRMSKVFISLIPSRDPQKINMNKSTNVKRIISRQDIPTYFWSMKRVKSYWQTKQWGCSSSPGDPEGSYNRGAHLPTEAGYTPSLVGRHKILLTKSQHQLFLHASLPSPLHHSSEGSPVLYPKAKQKRAQPKEN